MADNGGGFQLDNYVEVHERIKAFYEKHPEGSLQGTWTVEEVAGSTFVAYVARALRSPEDERPGIGHAWEPFPGKTPYTKDSELMNAETSAWGRAIAALGFEVHKGIASAQEVRNRSRGRAEEGSGPSIKQLDFLVSLAKQGGADPSDQENIRAYAKQNLTGGKTGSVSKTIELLKGENPGETLLKLTKAAAEWTAKNLNDVPAPDPSEPQPTAEENESVPF